MTTRSKNNQHEGTDDETKDSRDESVGLRKEPVQFQDMEIIEHTKHCGMAVNPIPRRYKQRGSFIKAVTKNRGRQTIYDSIRFK